MIGLLGKVAGLAAQNVAAVTVVAGGLVGFVVVGAVVVPSRGVALTASYEDESTLTTSQLTDDQNGFVEALKRLIESAHAIIDVAEDDAGSARLVLWIEDHRDIGIVNEDEVLVVSYAPLLHAVTGLTRPPVDTAAPAMATSALFSDTLSADWRQSPGVQQSILATNVTEMRMKSVGRSNGEMTVRVSLTFGAGESDDDPKHRAEAMFAVTLPAVARSR